MSPTYQDVESAIAGVPGVAEASVDAVSGSTRGRLRIRLAPGHDPEEVSREVSQVLRLRFGIDIAPEAIRPRPADEEPAPAVAAAAPGESSATAAPQGAAAAPTATGSAPADTAVREVDEDDAETEPAVAEDVVDDVAHDDAHDDEAAVASPPDRCPEGASTDAVADTDEAPAARAETRAGLPGVDELFRPTSRGPHGTPGNGHGQGSSRSWHRPIIRDLALGSRGLEIHAEVSLDLDGSEVRGTAIGPATRRSTFRAIARATLDAVETMFPGDVKTEVETVELVDDGDDERVTVTVTFLTYEGAEKLIGASIARGDAEQAVMRATLDAVNRRVGLLLDE